MLFHFSYLIGPYLKMIVEYRGCQLNQQRFFQHIGYEPHPSQAIIHKDNSRFKFLACGRRWGKSMLAASEIMKASVVPNQMLWIVAPTYELSKKVFREVYKYYTRKMPHWIEKKSEARLYLKLFNGTEIVGKSADNPDSLIGEGVTGMVIDEAARIKKIVWEESLRPTLSDNLGWCIAISTPRGRNWFFEGYIRGQDKLELTYASWSFKSANNPYFPPEEEIEAKRTSSSRAFEQEYLAMFLTDAGGVFRGVKACVKGDFHDGEGGVHYVMGVDLAKYTDFTVIIVIDLRDNHVVFFDRFNQIDWALQRKRIKSAAMKYGQCPVNIDATGVGDSVVEELVNDVRGTNIQIYPHKFDNRNKNTIIDNLAMMIEEGKVSFPEIDELINELQIFEYEITASGNTKLNAPDGYHDDCVISLALGCMGINLTKTVDNFAIA